MNTVELVEIYDYLKDEMTPRTKGFIEKLQKEYSKEIERLNNIINELEKYINEQKERSDYTRIDTFDEVYDYLQELKGVDKE